MEGPAAFTIQSSREEIEFGRRIRVKHASTGHIHEFRIGLSEAGGWVIELETWTHPNPRSSVEPLESQAAARRAAREFIKSYSIEMMSHEIDGAPVRQSFLY
jgi:hypothetical protein